MHDDRRYRTVAALRGTSEDCCRLASTRASGINIANETILTTVIITTTFASLKF